MLPWIWCRCEELRDHRCGGLPTQHHCRSPHVTQEVRPFRHNDCTRHHSQQWHNLMVGLKADVSEGWSLTGCCMQTANGRRVGTVGTMRVLGHGHMPHGQFHQHQPHKQATYVSSCQPSSAHLHSASANTILLHLLVLQVCKHLEAPPVVQTAEARQQ